ncbi:MAG: superoxide dismutase [Candidatus Omnitrophica bacterium]|nr:superoxide dismutase [Candidatus Omnitrophota bacterium]
MTTAAVELPKLPFEGNALEPVISGRTLEFHYGKHHKAYVDKTNALTEGADLAGKRLEDVIRAAAGDASKKGLFNNAAQVWNHTFFWKSLSPKQTSPSAGFAEKIKSAFGSQEEFNKKFAEAGAGQFGSGWLWLVNDGGKLAILTTSNAETPLTGSKKPLLVIDVWEHAYYLDYQNRRPDYLKAVIEKHLNWAFAETNF